MSQRMNLKPEFWGPHAWFLLENIALSYPMEPSSKDKKTFKNFFISLKNILPCESCRDHYKESLEKIPLTSQMLESRDTLFGWVVGIHNRIRKAQNKKLVTPFETIEFYNNEMNNKNRPNYKMICIIIVVCLIVIFLMKR